MTLVKKATQLEIAFNEFSEFAGIGYFVANKNLIYAEADLQLAELREMQTERTEQYSALLSLLEKTQQLIKKIYNASKNTSTEHINNLGIL